MLFRFQIDPDDSHKDFKRLERWLCVTPNKRRTTDRLSGLTTNVCLRMYSTSHFRYLFPNFKMSSIMSPTILLLRVNKSIFYHSFLLKHLLSVLFHPKGLNAISHLTFDEGVKKSSDSFLC